MCIDTGGKDRVGAGFVLSLSSCIGALDNSQTVTLVILPYLVTSMVEAKLKGGQVRHNIIVMSESLITLGRELLENEISKGLISASGRTEGVHVHSCGHTESSLDVNTGEGGEGTAKRVSCNQIRRSWMSSFYSFYS